MYLIPRCCRSRSWRSTPNGPDSTNCHATPPSRSARDRRSRWSPGCSSCFQLTSRPSLSPSADRRSARTRDVDPPSRRISSWLCSSAATSTPHLTKHNRTSWTESIDFARPGDTRSLGDPQHRLADSNFRYSTRNNFRKIWYPTVDPNEDRNLTLFVFYNFRYTIFDGQSCRSDW